MQIADLQSASLKHGLSCSPVGDAHEHPAEHCCVVVFSGGQAGHLRATGRKLSTVLCVCWEISYPLKKVKEKQWLL